MTAEATQVAIQRTRTIGVYLDDPVWDRHARWFNVPIPDLERLWVAKYIVSGDPTDRDVELAATQIREMHNPGVVLIY